MLPRSLRPGEAHGTQNARSARPRRGDPGCPPDKVAKEKSKPAPLETTRMRHPTLFLHSICRPPAGCGEGHGLPRSLRPGEAHGTQNARAVADVRAARREEKA